MFNPRRVGSQVDAVQVALYASEVIQGDCGVTIGVGVCDGEVVCEKVEIIGPRGEVIATDKTLRKVWAKFINKPISPDGPFKTVHDVKQFIANLPFFHFEQQ